MKVLAVLLGPAGVGILSIYNNLYGMANKIAGLGIGSSGVREIASARGNLEIVSKVRHVMSSALLIQGLLALAAVLIARETLSVWLFGNANRADDIALVGVATLIALLSTSKTTLLQGMRRIGDLGRVTVAGALAATVGGLAAVVMLGEKGLIWFLLAQPLSTLFCALYFTRSLKGATPNTVALIDSWNTWKPMVRLGAGFMVGGLATTATLLLARARISNELGIDAVGHFAAAWGITMTYVGFLLGAMGADYYPRLTEVINNKKATLSLINDQTQLGMAIGGPILLVLIGFAPWVIELLYSAEFAAAITLLQWQTVGNVFKLASWALGFSIVAAARSKIFMIVQINFNILFLALLWPTLSSFGIIAAGPAFTVAYIIHFLVVYTIVRRIHNFRWEPLSLKLFITHASLAGLTLLLSMISPILTAVVVPFIALVTGAYGLRVVLIKVGTGGKVAKKLVGIYAAIGWPIQKDEL